MKAHKLLKRLHGWQKFNLSILFIRFWLGTIMLKHSTNYLFGGKMPELTSFLAESGFPLPDIMAYSSQIIELVTSVMILMGLRAGAFILALNMLVAVVFAHNLLIYTEGELAFNYFIFALILTLMGCGQPSLDHKLFAKYVT